VSTDSFEELVRANLRKIEASPDFAGDQIWLSFDLHGSPPDLKRLSEHLSTRGWIEIDVSNCWEGGFIYPRRLVKKSFEAIKEATDAIDQLCRLHGAEIVLVDAFNAPSSGPNAKCITLYDPP